MDKTNKGETNDENTPGGDVTPYAARLKRKHAHGRRGHGFGNRDFFCG